MRQMVVLTACALALAGCQTAAAPPPATSHISDSQAIALARDAIVQGLKDPASAQFGPMRRESTADPLGRKFDVVCGTVNAKNSFGGFTGQTLFVYNLQDRSIYMNQGDQTARLIVLSLCS